VREDLEDVEATVMVLIQHLHHQIITVLIFTIFLDQQEVIGDHAPIDVGKGERASDHAKEGYSQTPNIKLIGKEGNNRNRVGFRRSIFTRAHQLIKLKVEIQCILIRRRKGGREE